MEKKEIQEGGWNPLSAILGVSHPFFDKCLFLEGYDISSNIYVVEGDYLSIIDPGNDYTAFINLFELGYKPTDIRKIVLTHGHPEHAMGTFELFRYPSIAQEKNIEIFLDEEGPDTFKKLVEEFGCTLTEVKNGDILDLGGFDLEVIHTPGHTMDSLCFYHAPTKSIFTGDTVIPYAVASPDEIAGGRADYYLFSLKILLGMDIEHLLPGHGMPVAREGKRVIEGSYAGAIKQAIGLRTTWLEGASQLAQKGYLEEALFCCEKELEEAPDNMRALELKASCLSDTGKFEEALKAFDLLEQKQRDYPFALVGKGYSLMGLGEYEKSLPYFDKALSVSPDTKIARIYKGMALYLLGRHDEALKIKEFKTELVDRFRKEMEKRSEAPQRGKEGDTAV
jgi:hydroxyacylglutathione hydrolase